MGVRRFLPRRVVREQRSPKGGVQPAKVLLSSELRGVGGRSQAQSQTSHESSASRHSSIVVKEEKSTDSRRRLIVDWRLASIWAPSSLSLGTTACSHKAPSKASDGAIERRA